MITFKRERIYPRKIRIDAATACQLKCPACPTASGETGKRIGVGFLSLQNFKEMVDRYPEIAHIELTNWGEIFLNKELEAILAYAHRRNIALYAANGANLNNVTGQMCEAVVKYKFREITCSIDGATQEVYEKYRVRGNLETVLGNIRKINHYKQKYRSPFPRLRWQFIAFGHNQHEIPKARALAKELGMEFFVKLEWGNLYNTQSLPATNKDIIRKEMDNGVADREEYQKKYGLSYEARECCIEMWTSPQVNFNGKVLGCPVNYWADYGNAFADGSEKFYNSEGMTAAREMLMGKRPAVEGLPCTTCKVYTGMKQRNQWITDTETRVGYQKSRKIVFLENKLLGPRLTSVLCNLWFEARRRFSLAGLVLRKGGGLFGALKVLNPLAKDTGDYLSSRVSRVSLPFSLQDDEKWKPQFLFRGFTMLVDDLTCHVSALKHGHTPHPPHRHKEEEILVMLDGEAELILPELGSAGENGPLTLQPGQFVYYPSGFLHTIRTTSSRPAHYMMFKWFSPDKGNDKKLGFGKFDIADMAENKGEQNGFSTHLMFDGKTACLDKLHCHTSSLAPGAGYDAHTDDYDVAILVLDGEVQTLGKKVTVNEVAFFPAGEPHGMRNEGARTARYIVIEFHQK